LRKKVIDIQLALSLGEFGSRRDGFFPNSAALACQALQDFQVVQEAEHILKLG
jgi:hypothetical protein